MQERPNFSDETRRALPESAEGTNQSYAKPEVEPAPEGPGLPFPEPVVGPET